MKTTKTLALLSTLGMLAGAALSPTGAGDNPGPLPPPGRFGGGRPDPEMRRKMITEKYDANQDGKLDDRELATLGRDVVEGRFGPPPGMNRRGPDGQGSPGFGGVPRAQGPAGFGGDHPPVARGQGGPGFDGPRPPEPRGEGPAGFGQGGGREGDVTPRRAPSPDRDGGSERGQFGPGPGVPGGAGERGHKAMEMRRREFVKKYDADGDGKLSPSEREAIGRDIEEGKLPPPPLAPPQPPQEPRQPRPPE